MKKEIKFGSIKYKDITFYFSVYGYRYGRGLRVSREFYDDKGTLLKMKSFTVTFGCWHFEPKKEAKKIITKYFNEFV